MPKRLVHRRQIQNHPGLCCSPASEGHHDFPLWDGIFNAFFSESDEATLESALNEDIGMADGNMWKLWVMARSHIIDSRVLRLFVSDCVYNAAERLSMDEQVVLDAIQCARSYSREECDHDMLVSTRDRVQARLDEMDDSDPHCHKRHFLNTVRHTLEPHPDSGSIQCIMNIPRCLEQIGENAISESNWQMAALKARCEEAGYFDEA